MEGVSFSGDMSSANQDPPAGVRWEAPDDWTLASTVTSREEAPDGTLISERITLEFGETRDDLDWRFTIRVHRDTQLEDVLDADKTYETQEIGGVTYTVYAPYGDPYDCYVQRGDDVWQISNSGVSNGLFYSRSDESSEAFVRFLPTVQFDD